MPKPAPARARSRRPTPPLRPAPTEAGKPDAGAHKPADGASRRRRPCAPSAEPAAPASPARARLPRPRPHRLAPRRRERPSLGAREPRRCAGSRASSASDLARVNGSGPKGRILKEDVQDFVKARCAGGARPAAARRRACRLDLPPWPKVDFAKFGPVESKPLSRIQKISGADARTATG